MAERQWFTPEEAAPMMGKPSAAAMRYWLDTRRKAGVLRLGYHYKSDGLPGARRPTWLIHVDRCQQIGDRVASRRA